MVNLSKFRPEIISSNAIRWVTKVVLGGAMERVQKGKR